MTRPAPAVKLRYRADPRRCGSCGTQWSTRWFHPHKWPVPLCADCNCSCKQRGVDHADCVDRYPWTARVSDDDELATEDPAAVAERQLELPL